MNGTCTRDVERKGCKVDSAGKDGITGTHADLVVDQIQCSIIC